ncbi:MAG: hypothetical protein RI897_1875 [Verrucomicrobiota bacterium]
MVVEDDPVGAVEFGFIGEVTDPGGGFEGLALAPAMGVVGESGDFGIVPMFGEALCEEGGQKAIQVTFVGQDDFGL